ncbi:MAG: carbohydrate ABC transporter permease [Candidatus Borkfalkiaceae bacterium]|nr:carbohydrate ABC transporter permease [Christensenellaceae bacterium]
MKVKVSKGRRVFTVLNYSALTLLTLVFVIPYMYVLATSFTDEFSFGKIGFRLWPSQWSTAAYRFLLTYDTQMIRAVFNSIVVTVAGTLLVTFVSTLYAYPLSKKYLRGNKFFSVVMIFTMLFNGGLIPYFFVVSNLFDDSLWALIVPGCLAPYYVILIRNFFAGIPDSLEEACKIDGGNDFLILFRIYLPLSMSVIATVMLFAAVSKWNDYTAALLFITTKNKYPLQYFIQMILDNPTDIYASTTDLPRQTIKYAAVVFGSMPMIILYPFLQKYYINGMMLGSVKE